MSDAHRDEIAKLEALYAEHPEGRIFTHLAEAYRKAGELGRAREVLDEGIGRHPDYSSAHVVLGRVLVDQGQTSEAEAEFRRVLELDAQNLVALRSLGDLARADGRRDDALEHYRALLEVEPADDEVRELIEATERGEGLGSPAGVGAEPAQPEEAESPDAMEPPAPDDFGQGLAGDEDEDLPTPEVEADLEPAGLEGGGAFVGSPADDVSSASDDPEWRAAGEASDAGAEQEGDWLGGMPEVEAEGEDGEWVGDVAELAGGGMYETGEGPGEGEDAEGTADDGAVEGPGPEAMEEATEAWAGATEPEADTPVEPWGQEPADASPADDGPGVAEPPHAGRPGVTTETIAHVYARQGLYDRAAEVYRELVRERPDDPGLRERLNEMEQLAAQMSSVEKGATAEALEDEPAGAYGLGEPPAAEPTPLAGFESGEVDLGSAEASPLEGLESREIDPETGLAADVGAATPPAEPTGLEDVRDVPAPPEEREPWAEPSPSGEAAPERDSAREAEEASVWTGDDWGETDRETPYAWAEEEDRGEADAGEPIDQYFRGLLGWSKQSQGEPADAAPETAEPAEPADTTGEAEAQPSSATGSGEPEMPARSTDEASGDEAGEAAATTEPGAGEDDDEDLDMFRSWLESLKQ